MVGDHRVLEVDRAMSQFRCRIGLGAILILVCSAPLVGQNPSPATAPATPPKPSVDQAPDNLIQVAPQLYSGGEPHTREQFAALQKLGVKTIISVDGALPDTQLAHEFGMRYVHVPIGYDTIPAPAVGQLDKAVKELKGPFFVHCHHGKHRGPAAAAICGRAAGWIDDKAAMTLLEQAKTGKNYKGLWESVRSFTPVEIRSKEPLVEQATVDALVVVMARLSRRFEELSAKPAKKEDRRHLATLLQEDFVESARLQDVDPTMKAGLEETARLFQELHEKSDLSDGVLDRQIPLIKKRCDACHVEHRD